jgi:hypothetical protein
MSLRLAADSGTRCPPVDDAALPSRLDRGVIEGDVFAAKDFYAEGDNLVRWTPSQPGMAPYDVWRNSS